MPFMLYVCFLFIYFCGARWNNLIARCVFLPYYVLCYSKSNCSLNIYLFEFSLKLNSHVILKKHAKLNADRVIGGALNVIKLKNDICYVEL